MRFGKIRHAGLRRLLRDDDIRGLPGASLAKLSNMLFFLKTMNGSHDLLQHRGWRPHRLKGKRGGGERWSLRVSANWRLTFRIDGDEITDLDFEDYH